MAEQTINSKKVAILFRGVLGDLRPSEASPEQPCYFLSPINTSISSSKPHYEYRTAKSFGSIQQRGEPRMPVNGFSWLQEDPQMMETLFYNPGMPTREMFFFLRNASESFLKRCSELDIEVQKLDFKPVGMRSPISVLGLRFTRADQFSGLFWPNYINSLHDTMLLSFKGSSLSPRKDINRAGNRDFFSEILHSANVCRYFASAEKWNADWVYTIKSDFSHFDSGNSIYCVDSQFQSAFETSLHTTFTTRGYDFHVVPMLKSLIWNWQYFGEIPVIY